MRLNSSVGVVDVRDALKNKWGYLRLADADSSYDGNELTDSVTTISIDSVNTGSNYFERIFYLGFLDGNSVDFTAIADAVSDTGDVVDSYEEISTFSKNNIEQYRITIKTEIIR